MRMSQAEGEGSNLHPSLPAGHVSNKSVRPFETGKAVKTSLVILLLAAVSSKQGWVPRGKHEEMLSVSHHNKFGLSPSDALWHARLFLPACTAQRGLQGHRKRDRIKHRKPNIWVKFSA